MKDARIVFGKKVCAIVVALVMVIGLAAPFAMLHATASEDPDGVQPPTYEAPLNEEADAPEYETEDAEEPEVADEQLFDEVIVPVEVGAGESAVPVVVLPQAGTVVAFSDCDICGTCADCLLVEGSNRIRNGNLENYAWSSQGFVIPYWGQYAFWTGAFQGFPRTAIWTGGTYTTGYSITLEPGVYRLSTYLAFHNDGNYNPGEMYLRPSGGGAAVPGTTIVFDRPDQPRVLSNYVVEFTVTTELTGLQLFAQRGASDVWIGPTSLVRVGGDPDPGTGGNGDPGNLIFHLNDATLDTWFDFGHGANGGALSVERLPDMYNGIAGLRYTTTIGSFETQFPRWGGFDVLGLEPNREYLVTGVTRVTGAPYAGVHVVMFHRNGNSWDGSAEYPHNVLPMGEVWTPFSFTVTTLPNHDNSPDASGLILRGNSLPAAGVFYFANMRVYDMGALDPVPCDECGEDSDYCICCPLCNSHPCACPPTDWDVEFIFGNIFNEGDSSVANSYRLGNWVSEQGVSVTNEGRGVGSPTIRFDGFVGFIPVALEANTAYRVRVLARNEQPGADVGPQNPMDGEDTDTNMNKISFQYASASSTAAGFAGDKQNMYITSTSFEWIEIEFTTPADMTVNWSGHTIIVFAMRAGTSWIQELIVERVSDGVNVFNNGNSNIGNISMNTTWDGAYSSATQGLAVPTDTVRIEAGGHGTIDIPVEAGRTYEMRVLARGNGTVAIAGIHEFVINNDAWQWHTITATAPLVLDEALVRLNATGTLWVEGIVVLDLNPPARPAQIIVDPDVTFQEIEGMGFFGARDVWWNHGWSTMVSPEWVDEVLIDLGVTMWRNEAFPFLNPACGVNNNSALNPNCQGTLYCCMSDFDYAYHRNLPLPSRPAGDDVPVLWGRNQDASWAVQIPVVTALWNRAQELDIDFRIILSAWTPPAQWKTNQSTKGGGYIMPQYYELYGQWWVEVLDMYAALGIEVYAISLQNEPGFPQPYNSMRIYAANYLALMQAALPIIKEAHPDVLVFGSECMLRHQNEPWWSDFHFNTAIENNLVSTQPGDPGSLHGLFDRFALHGYYDGVLAQAIGTHRDLWTRDANTHTMLPTWMTETSGYGFHWFDAGGVAGALNLGMAMHMALVYGNISAWVYWQGHDTSTNSEFNIWSTNDNRNKFAASQHFFRYLRPGTVRVGTAVAGAAQQDDLLVSAYVDAENELAIVIAVNSSEYDHIVSISGFGSDVEFRMYYSTADESINFQLVDSLMGTENIIIPAKSIVTLVAEIEIEDDECNECGQDPCECPQLGDINEDGNVDFDDAMLLTQYVMGFPHGLPFNRIAADVNQDGTINVADQSMLVMHLHGIIPELGAPTPAPATAVASNGLISIVPYSSALEFDIVVTPDHDNDWVDVAVYITNNPGFINGSLVLEVSGVDGEVIGINVNTMDLLTHGLMVAHSAVGADAFEIAFFSMMMGIDVTFTGLFFTVRFYGTDGIEGMVFELGEGPVTIIDSGTDPNDPSAGITVDWPEPTDPIECEECEQYPCVCCPVTGLYPCECVCDECGNLLDDCDCCDVCETYPCECVCDECGNLLDDCDCCDVCETYPCECDDETPTPPTPPVAPPIAPPLPPQTVRPTPDTNRPLLPLVPRPGAETATPEDEDYDDAPPEEGDYEEEYGDYDEDETQDDVRRRVIRFVMQTLSYTVDGAASGLDVVPFIDPAYNRVMIPLRAVIEALGQEVAWDEATQTVTIFTANGTVTLVVGVSLPGGMGVPVLINGRVLVPLRYVSEVIGAEVRFDGDNAAAYVYMFN